MSRCPFVAQDYGDLGETKFHRGFQAKVSVHDFAAAPHQAGNLEAELPDGRAHSVHYGVVLSGVCRVRVGFSTVGRSYRRRERAAFLLG